MDDRSEATSPASERQLYARCLTVFTNTVKRKQLYQNPYLHSMPPRVLADIYLQMSHREDLRDFLGAELADLDVFVHLLQNGFTRSNLIALISNLFNRCINLPLNISEIYAVSAKHYLSIRLKRRKTTTLCAATTSFAADDGFEANDHANTTSVISYGLVIGSFFSDAGWWCEAITVLRASLNLIQAVLEDEPLLPVTTPSPASPPSSPTPPSSLRLTQLQCITRLLYAESRYFEFPAATRTYGAGVDLVARLGIASVPRTLRTMWYSAVSVQYFARSDYDNSSRWGIAAVRELTASTPAKLTVDVLRQTAKACVLKRHFGRARMLLVQALEIARRNFGVRHYKYADALMDCAFYLLNVDAIHQSVQTYKEALKIRVALLGQRSLPVAIAQEDLAYALYVHNYSSGHFLSALAHVEKAIGILCCVVPSTHLFLASAKRVKALILEEIALEEVTMLEQVGENDRRAAHHRLLLESEELHQSALRLSLDAFGEVNVQTAKHYGNLGRLYQSMTKYDDAESMHNRAIRIKTDILGPFDFEVGLSIGHLASLYNYHMGRYRDAEVLYLRSIDVSLRLFGDAYSGLEYDYRGLCNVYEMLEDEDKYFKYQMLLEDWRHRRANRDETSAAPFDLCDDQTLEEMTKLFLEQLPPSSSTASITDAPDETATVDVAPVLLDV